MVGVDGQVRLTGCHGRWYLDGVTRAGGRAPAVEWAGAPVPEPTCRCLLLLPAVVALAAFSRRRGEHHRTVPPDGWDPRGDAGVTERIGRASQALESACGGKHGRIMGPATKPHLWPSLWLGK